MHVGSCGGEIHGKGLSGKKEGFVLLASVLPVVLLK